MSESDAVLEEMHERAWKMIRLFGEELMEGGSIYCYTGKVAVELSYSSTGTEFLDVSMDVDRIVCAARIYRETDGRRARVAVESEFMEALEHLRQYLVLEDLADV